MDWRSVVQIQADASPFYLLQNIHFRPKAYPDTYSTGTDDFFSLWLKRLVRNSELWLPCIAEIKNEWNYNFNPPYDFMACNKTIYILAFLFFPEYPSLFSLPGFFL